MQVVILTHSASPYQVELFNVLAASGAIELKVIYLYRTDPTRRWTPPPLLHKAVCIDQEQVRPEYMRKEILTAELAVFNYYAEQGARVLINARAASGKPWCFWGERPGFRKPEWIGRLVRRCFLSSLHDSQVPIWGIGRFAVERYETEFGPSRTYCNLPYFSDLTRFQSAVGTQQGELAERVFLFSGSLIHRKGVDLLGRAFVRLAREWPNVRLKLLGDGEQRRELAQTLQPVRNRVEVLGFRDWADLPSCYADADILCVPSRYEGWGLVVPEGLASGLPVIGTNRMGAALEFLKTGRNGWLISAGDEEALYAALNEAASLSSDQLVELSRRARESVSEHSLELGAERFIHAAHEAVANWQS